MERIGIIAPSLFVIREKRANISIFAIGNSAGIRIQRMHTQ